MDTLADTLAKVEDTFPEKEARTLRKPWSDPETLVYSG